MADVQLENGYVAIANRLYEAVLQADFRESHLRILLALIRLTYGWRQRSVRLPSYAQLARCARLEPNGGGFSVAIRELTAQGVIKTHPDGTIALQKNFTQWGIYSVAEARLVALFSKRPDPGTAPPEREDSPPRREEPPPTREDVHGASRGNSTASTAENHRKPEKDNTATTARELSIAANQGLAEHATRPQPIPRIIATNGSSHEAAAAITLAGVPTDFAKSQIYELARTHNADGYVKSLKYFVPAVVERWQQHEAQRDAAHADRPVPVASRRDAVVSGADPDVWKRAADELREHERNGTHARSH